MKQETLDYFKTVQTGVVTDAMYLLGLKGWTTDIFPLRPEARVFGRAFTLQAVPLSSKEQPSYTIYDMKEHWKEGDVLVIDGMGLKLSMMGENMAHYCMYGGLAGVVMYGRCRDYGQIRDLEMPVFGMGPAMELKNGHFKYGAYNVPVNLGGALVNPGDYILGDIDGVLVIPANHLEAVKYQAEMIQEAEEEMERAIRAGAGAREIQAIAAKKKTARA